MDGFRTGEDDTGPRIETVTESLERTYISRKRKLSRKNNLKFVQRRRRQLFCC